MSTSRLALLALLAGAIAGCTVYTAPPPPMPVAGEMDDAEPAPPPAVAPAAVDVNVFYSDLAPYGEWIESPAYGRVWLPRVRVGWRPYTEGRWVYSDAGWTFVAEQEWGWAPFHYGRWYQDAEYGWLWVPGTVWGPAWVSWQHGGGYLGWAPLPPAVGFTAGVGLQLGGLRLSAVIEPSAYCFVSERAILEPRLATVIVPPVRNVTIIRNTTNITNYTVINNTVVNHGVAVQRVEQVTGQRVQRLRLASVSAPSGSRQARIQGNQLAIYRPPVATQKAAQAPPGQSGRATGGRRGGMQAAASDAATAGAHEPTPGELRRQHEAEQQDLVNHQEQERKRLESIHQQERASGGATTATTATTADSAGSATSGDAPRRRRAPADAAESNAQRGQQGGQGGAGQGNQKSEELKQRHDAEVHALQQQHQREQQQLAARHQREAQAAEAKAKEREAQQQAQKQKEKEKEKEKERKPPSSLS